MPKQTDLNDVLEYIDHCSHSEQAQIQDAVGAGQPVVEQPECSNTLFNAINKKITLDQEEKLILLINNIDTVNYGELKQLCQKGNL